MLSGSCLCGAVCYEIDAPIESASHCHYSQCRKVYSAAFAIYGRVRRETSRYVTEADAVAEYHSSSGVTRTFCRHCGPNLQWLGGNEDPTYASIALGTLGSPLPPAAQRHTYVGSKVGWYITADDLLREHQYRPALARRDQRTTDEVAAMLLNLFSEVHAAKVPVSVRESLGLIDVPKHHVVFADMDEFYYLARTIMVKDECHFDKLDRAFGAYFKDLEELDDHLKALIPEEWLREEFERLLTDEEKAQIRSLGGLDKLIEELKKRLGEQKERHAGGNKWVGTGGTSPFGSGGFNPEGVRVGGAGKRQGKAAKVWDQREYKNPDDQVELDTRNIKIVLRRLRKFAREGTAEELGIDGTIDHTAKDAGLLNIQMRPRRRSTAKSLLLLDIGGSMGAHVKICEELFSACKTEFKHLEYLYLHNFIYESVWKNNLRRSSERTVTFDLLHKYGPDHKVVLVDDAAMAPYEITQAGDSVEHWNGGAGYVWMQRFTEKYRKPIWINPYPKDTWDYTAPTGLVRELVKEQMYPLTLGGLEEGMRFLSHG